MSNDTQVKQEAPDEVIEREIAYASGLSNRGRFEEAFNVLVNALRSFGSHGTLASASTVAPQRSDEDPHPGYDCGGTCVIHSGRFTHHALESGQNPPKNIAFEVWWKGEIASDFVQQALDELEKISCVKLSGGFGPEATAVSAARRKLDSALSTLREANTVTSRPTSTAPASPAALRDEAIDDMTMEINPPATTPPSTAADKIADQLIPHLDHAFLLTKGWRDQIASIIERSLSSGS